MDNKQAVRLQSKESNAKADHTHNGLPPLETDRQCLHLEAYDNNQEAETPVELLESMDCMGDLSFPLQRLPRSSSRPKDFEDASQVGPVDMPPIVPQRKRLGSQRCSLRHYPDDLAYSETWKEKLYEYCQGASIHGLKQVTERQPLKSRRMTWLVLLLLGLSFFVYQMYQAISYYRTWPVSININIEYNETIQFPAVTLCNQNAFRLSAAQFYDHYNLTTEFYINPRTVNLSAYPTAAQHYITDLYTLAAHRRDNLFVECFWDGSPCEDDDISVTLTDFGVCYTFNSGTRGREIKYAAHTGSQSGLQLRLNIEQYEYMKGPNTGAGIKLHLHDQGDIALVKDQGIAVAPGTHAFVAVDLVKINILGPPHGTCQSDIKLRHYDKYTAATCMMDCLQRHVVGRCRCRDFYMPLANTTFPMCTLSEYQDCLIPTYDTFRQQKTAICSCPNPCHVTVFQPSVSYASMSNFDTDAMLYRDSPVDLQTSFVKAREAAQKVTQDIVQKDTKLILSFTDIVHNFTKLFSSWNATVAYSRTLAFTIYRELQMRYGFHSRVALGKLKYVIRHEFVRGWEVAEERAIRYVTDNFYDLIDSFNYFVEFANTSSTEAETRAAWYYVENVLQSRRRMALRSIDNITKAYSAFTQGERLVNYKSTIEERYDKSFAATSILIGQYGESVEEYYDGMMKSLRSFLDSLETLISLGKTFVQTNVLDPEIMAKCQGSLITAGKKFNYDTFRFSDRIVEGSLVRVERIIDEYDTAWLDVEQAYHEMTITLTDSHSLLLGIEPLWRVVTSVAKEAKLYLNHTSMPKTNLAQRVTGQLSTFIDSLDIFLRDLRSNSRIQTEKWYRWEHATKTFWEKMFYETNVREFYAMVYHDLQSYLNAKNIVEKTRYVKLLYWLLEENPFSYPELDKADDVWNLTERQLRISLNTEVYTTNLSDMRRYIHGNFTQHYLHCNLARRLGSSDEILINVASDFIHDMKEFLEGNKIDVSFYRENFLRLDVYLKNLRYEEVTQQKDYDLQKLLSDIGGSVGLFLGASVLSLFEFLDFVIFHPILSR